MSLVLSVSGSQGLCFDISGGRKSPSWHQLFRSNQSQIHNLLSQPCEPPNRPRPVSMPGLTPLGKWKSHRPKFCHQFEVQLRPQLCDVQVKKKALKLFPATAIVLSTNGLRTSTFNLHLYINQSTFNLRKKTLIGSQFHREFQHFTLHTAPTPHLRAPRQRHQHCLLHQASLEPGNYGQLPKMLENDD